MEKLKSEIKQQLFENALTSDSGCAVLEQEFDNTVDSIIAVIEQNRRSLLFELDDQVSYILGRPNFACGGIARILRKEGRDIPEKAEDEQAAVIYWMLGLYLEHGEIWLNVAEEKLREIDTK